MGRRMRGVVAVLGVALAMPAAARAQALTLSVKTPDIAVVAGERWEIAGTAPAGPVTVTVTRAGVVIADPVVPVTDGGFRVPMRVIRPGVLTIAARAGDMTAGPVTLDVRGEGAARRGCAGPAEVTWAAARHRGRLGDG